jgi:Fur family ferric uptake transcriptional regulator
MTNHSQTFKNILKSNQLSITEPRLLVFDLLINSSPLSINELIKTIDNKIDRVSVYRIINIFEKVGIIQRINIGWKYKIELTDKFQDHHHHLICLKCNKIIPIHKQSIELYINKLAAENHFSAKSHQIEIQGLCQDCR